jgi:hypothetical protein
MLELSFSGEGSLNGDGSQVVRWQGSMDTQAVELTMSNRLDVSGIDILSIRPYYDKYSPFIFASGNFSGELIFDFNNGNIGSTNVLRLSGVRFAVKNGYENSVFWETTVPELVKYFTTSSGEIVFDFKIKGRISEPKFYLGPISKKALTSMVVDKVSDAIRKMSENDNAGGDFAKAKKYIDIFKGIAGNN